MFKFFRKYQKVIILVGLPILLVIFLVPQAIQGIGSYVAQRGRTLGSYERLDGERHTINVAEYTEAQQQLAVITQGMRGINLTELFFSYGREVDEQGSVVPQAIVVDHAAHWLLLVNEARELGLIGGTADAEEMARAIALMIQQQQQQLQQDAEAMEPGEVINLLARNAGGLSGQAVIDTLANMYAVRRMFALYQGGGYRVSQPRLAAAAVEYFQGINARTVVIPARVEEELPEEPETAESAETEAEAASGSDSDSGEAASDTESTAAAAADEPTEEELQRQLEQYGEFNAGEGERGFGYRLPDRVKLEWIEIDSARIRERLASSDALSPIEVRKYWMQNKELFAPGEGDPEAVRFSDVAEQVRERLLDELVREKVQEIVRFAEGEIARSTLDLNRDGSYYELPEDWSEKRIALNELAEQIQEEFDVGLPTYHRRDDAWIAANEINMVPGVGSSETSRFGQPTRLAQILPVLKEFGGDPDEQIFVQEGVLLPVLELGGRRFFVRVTATQPDQPPTSIDEVRDALVRDLNRIAAYERLVERSSEIERQAETQGLQAVANEHESFAQNQNAIRFLPDEVASGSQIPNTRFMPPVNEDEEATLAIVDRARAILNDMITSGRAFDDLTVAERTFTVEVPEKLAIIVVQLTDLLPVTEESPVVASPILSMIITAGETAENALAIFEQDAMFRRFSYEGAATDAEDDAADEGATAEPEATAPE